MEKITDKFLRYVSYDTQSDENSSSQPSTAKQLVLLRQLVDELHAMGIADASLDKDGYVMASIESNVPGKVPAIGFIAHVDTSPDARARAMRETCWKDSVANMAFSLKARLRHAAEPEERD